MGQQVWASIYFSDVPQDALTVQVTAEQFQWSFHYAGADGKFGPTEISKITPTNNIGLDKEHPDAKDDIFSLGQMHVPVNRPVRIRLRSKDVTHSFFLPNLRVKQDAVPGLAIEVWFTPNKAGVYELACAELCGLQHYRMKASFTVHASEADFNKWMQDQLAQQ
jgi:cytochrome c oxidase subunit 2